VGGNIYEYKRILRKYIMHILHYIFLFTATHISVSSLDSMLGQQNKPICANCKFFIPNKNKCSKFGEVNLITGKHNYEMAVNVRKDKNKCGEDGVFYEKNNFKFITIPYYFLLDNAQYILLLSYGFLPIILWSFLFTRL
jgi:hypothetical protein